MKKPRHRHTPYSTVADNVIEEAKAIAQRILLAQPTTELITPTPEERRIARQRTPDKQLKWATMDHDTLQRWVTDPNRSAETDEAKQTCYQSMASQQGLTEDQAHAVNHAAGMHEAFQTVIHDSVRYRLFSRSLAQATNTERTKP